MERQPLAEGVLVFRFPPYAGKHYGFSLHALLDERARTALLIDAGYEEHAAAVRESLADDGYGVAAVVVSHFHPDHVSGLRALPGTSVIGSPRFEETLHGSGGSEGRREFKPLRTVADEDVLSFGSFRLRFRAAPGHSPCSIYTLIDDRFLHVADNVMLSEDGRDILPWAEYDRIGDHIRSLEALRNWTDRTWLLSHGGAIEDAAVARRAIANRVRYFQAVLAGEGRITYEEAVASCDCEFLHREWLIHRPQ